MRANNAVVLSDFHLFSERSQANEFFNQTNEQISQLEHLFLLGDIFDFKWSKHSIDESIKLAHEWLENLLEQFPNIHIHYVVGNHDAWKPWIDFLKEFTHPRFHWSDNYLQYKDSLFLHGDLPLYGFNSRPLSIEKPKSTWLRKCYALLCETKIQNIIIKFNFREKQCLTILKWLKSNCIELNSIKRIYFGHTHRPIKGMRIDDIEFYNSGSLVKHMPCSPLFFHFKR